MQPVIGITAGKENFGNKISKTCLIDKYIQSITLSGGIPLIIPSGIPQNQIDTLLSRIDGVLISGGGDIDPVRFNGKPHQNIYGIDKARDQLEISLIQAVAKNGKPLLGICRGMQAINVALGGDLYTDISDQFPNSLRHDWYPNFPRDLLSHDVSINQGTLLHKIIGSSSTRVNSLHHQAIKCLSEELIPTAISPDGLVEALESNSHPFLIGIQWHPEWLYEMDHARKLFDAFIFAAKPSAQN